MERSFPREIGALGAIFGFISECFQQSRIDGSYENDVGLIVEELFTNMVKYNPEGTQDILVGLDRTGDDLMIEVTDFGVHEYDITQRPEVDTSAPIAQRRPGGLGIHFVRTIADEITYQYDDGNSRIRVRKRVR